MNEPRERQSDDLDETLEETFPASDAPANTVATGIRLAVDRPIEGVKDNPDAHRFELVVDGEVAYLEYEHRPHALVLVHTEVPPALRGRRLGEALIKAAFEAARHDGLRIVPVCPYVKAFLRKHPDRSEG